MRISRRGDTFPAAYINVKHAWFWFLMRTQILSRNWQNMTYFIAINIPRVSQIYRHGMVPVRSQTAVTVNQSAKEHLESDTFKCSSTNLLLISHVLTDGVRTSLSMMKFSLYQTMGLYICYRFYLNSIKHRNVDKCNNSCWTVRLIGVYSFVWKLNSSLYTCFRHTECHSSSPKATVQTEETVPLLLSLT